VGRGPTAWNIRRGLVVCYTTKKYCIDNRFGAPKHVSPPPRYELHYLFDRSQSRLFVACKKNTRNALVVRTKVVAPSGALYNRGGGGDKNWDLVNIAAAWGF
jgi:hypothetical protein